MKKILSIFALLFSSVAFATTLVPVQTINPTGSTSGQVVLSNGPVTAPSWGNVAAASLAAQAANTVVANATGSSASPTAFAMPSCTPNTGALGWTSSTGFICNTSLNATVLLGFNWAIPGAIGSTTPNTGSFTTLATSGLYHATNTSAGASVIELTGNGATTPNKFLGVLGGLFTLYSSSGGAQLLSVDDSGNGIFTGSITPSQTGGIVGTNTNNDANAGSVGEYPTPTDLNSVSMTSGASVVNVASIPLAAGDWDVSGVVSFNPAGSTVVSYVVGGISSTSATLPPGGTGAAFQIPGSATAGIAIINSTGDVRVKLASAGTVYLVANGIFSTSTMTASGFIRARRPR